MLASGWKGQYEAAASLGVSRFLIADVARELGLELPIDVSYLCRWGQRTSMRVELIGRKPDRSEWERLAVEEGIPVEHLHGLAAEMKAVDLQGRQDRLELLAEARRISIGLGYGDLRTVAARVSRRGIDEDSVKGLDDVAALVAGKYADHFGGSLDPRRRLFELLLEGDPLPLADEDAYARALEQLVSYRRQWAA